MLFQCWTLGPWTLERLFFFFFFIQIVFLRAWTVLSVCVCVFVCVSVGRGSFWRRGPQRSFFFLFFFFTVLRGWKFSFLTILRCTLLFSHNEQNCEQIDQKFLIHKRVTLSPSCCGFFSYNWYRFAFYFSSPSSDVIFLPLHVEKLLILSLANVVGSLPK